MEPVLIGGSIALILWLLGKKKPAASGFVRILATADNFTKIKYRLQTGSEYVESWITKAERFQAHEKGKYLFAADFLPDGSGISFFIYEKGTPDKLIFSEAWAINSAI